VQRILFWVHGDRSIPLFLFIVPLPLTSEDCSPKYPVPIQQHNAKLVPVLDPSDSNKLTDNKLWTISWSMGRTRGKGKAAKGDNGIDLAYTEELDELLVSLLDVCGLFDDNTQNGVGSLRLKMVDSIENLSTKLRDAQSSSQWEDQSLPCDESFFGVIRRVEECCGIVRRDAEAFLQRNGEEFTQVIEICHHIDNLLSTQQQNIFALRFFVRSVLELYRLQSALEREIVVDCLKSQLNDLYTPDNVSGAELQLDNIARCLSRETFIEEFPFQDEVMLIRQRILREEISSSINDAELGAAFSTCMVEEDVSLDYADADSEVVHAKTVLAAVEAFVRSHRNYAAPHVTTILVQGPDGSGKTHLCNEIEHMTASSAYGMSL
jgi:hypothetical protein